MQLDDRSESLLVVALGIVAGGTPSPEALNQDAGTVALENTLEAVHIDLEVKEVLLGRAFVGVVGDVQLHELVEATEAVTEGGVLDALLIGYHVVIERLEARNRVHQEVTVARDLTHWIVEERDLHNLGEGGQRLQVLPLGNVVIVQVQELKALQARKDLRLRQTV